MASILFKNFRGIKLGRKAKWRPVLPAVGLEKQYAGAIKNILLTLTELIKDRLKPRLQYLASEAQRASGIKRDDYGDDFSEIINGIRIEMATRFNDDELKRLADQYGVRVAGANENKFSENLNKVLGVNIITSEPYLTSVLNAFNITNVSLIKNLSESTIQQIEQLTLRGFSQGLRWETIAADLTNRLEVASSRADLIARDQMGKLNSQLTVTRQKNIGVTRGIWRTAADERVRDSHRAMEGVIFDLDSPPRVDGENVFPGEAINCRCFTEPVISDLTDIEEET